MNYLYFALHRKQILAHKNAVIRGLKNITTKGLLQVGTSYVGFSMKNDKTFLNIRGKLITHSDFLIGRGCRFDIGPSATCILGSGFINVNTKLIIMHGLQIGYNVAIGWDCEIIDEDFHSISYNGKQERDKKIVIGNHVWIGSGVKILKGVKIGDNNVIAGSSVVTKSFDEQNVLIAGNPAKIIKREISWE